jgi:hypothetical protein
MELEFKHDHSQPFELVLVTRDAKGEPTGKKQYFTDDAYKLSQFYLRNRGKPKSKKKDDGKAKTDANIKTVKTHGSLQSYVDVSEREVKENEQQ